MGAEAVETAGADGRVVAVTVFPMDMPPTTGWLNEVFTGALPDPASGMSTVALSGRVAEKLRTPSVVSAAALITEPSGLTRPHPHEAGFR